MKRILVATDGSPSSTDAVSFGVELAAEHEAELIFVHVAPTSDLVPVVSATAMLRGETVDEIVAYADSHDVDLIVVGSRGHGTIASALLGSVSRGVLGESKRPALIVRASAVTVPAVTG